MKDIDSDKGPLVFDIARGSYADGPGMRTVVFLKGCPLRCLWCQNPESHHPHAEPLFYPEKCIHCGQCARGCYTHARQTAGVYYSPAKLAQLIAQDNVFYDVSQGGVTFSGGEPLLCIDYLYETAQRIKQEHIHIAVETCGYFDFDNLEKRLLPLIDLFLFDLKVMDPQLFETYTGKSNSLIIANFIKLRAAGAKIMPRIPLIPGFTAVEENLSQIAAFLVQQGVTQCQLLPYNPSGLDKWQRLGKKAPDNITSLPMTLVEEKKWVAFFQQQMEKESTMKNLSTSVFIF